MEISWEKQFFKEGKVIKIPQQTVYRDKSSPLAALPLSKIKTKINHEGKERKTSQFFMFVLGLLQQLLYFAFICFCGVS